MMTIIGSLLGFGTSFLPEVLNYFKRGQEQKHELQRMQMEMELMAKRSELNIAELDKQAEITETEGLSMIMLMQVGLLTHYEVVSVLSSLMLFLAYSFPLK